MCRTSTESQTVMKSRPKNDFSAVSRESQPIRKVTVPRQLVPRHSARTVYFSPERRRWSRGPTTCPRSSHRRGRGARREGGAGNATLECRDRRVRLGIASDRSSRPSGKYQIGLTPRSSHREFASTDDLTVWIGLTQDPQSKAPIPISTPPRTA